MRKTDTRTIGAHQYRVTQFGALEGRRVLARLIKVLGPLLAAADGKTKGEGAALAGLMGAVEHLKEEDVEFFCDTLSKYTEVCIEGRWPNLKDIFDAHFAGEYEELIGWLKFAIEVNFGSFFQKAGAKMQASALPIEVPQGNA